VTDAFWFRMRVILNFLILFFILASTGCSLYFVKVERPFLYEVSKGDKHFWILGTVHSGIALDQMPDVVFDKIKQADMVALETDDTGGAGLKAAIKTLTKDTEMPKEFDLRKALTPKAYNSAKIIRWFVCDKTKQKAPDCYVQPERMSPLIIKSFIVYLEKPAQKAQLVELLQLYPEIGNSSEKKYNHKVYAVLGRLDSEIEKYAKRKDVALMSLDTRDEKFNLNLAYAIESSDLNFNLDFNAQNFLADEQKAKDLNDAYLHGNESEIMNLIHLSDQVLPWLTNKQLLAERNELWFTKIEAEVKKNKNLFVACGLLHLLGPDNILNKFKDAGYTARRFNPERSVSAN
jgi:uncharacterized protein YbaP (TraB family)